MLLNTIKIRLGIILRLLICFKYRLLGVTIGKNVFISHRAKIDTTYPGSIEIGDNCYITFNALILSHDHSVSWHRYSEIDSGRGRTVLEKHVFVGAGAIILRNTRIGENSIIGSGAVVSIDVPPNSIVAGNPARILKRFEPRATSTNES